MSQTFCNTTVVLKNINDFFKLNIFFLQHLTLKQKLLNRKKVSVTIVINVYYSYSVSKNSYVKTKLKIIV